MSIYGFIVGIEKYDQPTWDVEGPCTNALAVAEWLISLKQPGTIHLFLSSTRKLDDAIARIKSDHVVVHPVGDTSSIDRFWRLQLAKDVPAESRLLVFWSGHGFASATRNRIFFCDDYQSKLPDRVFNASNFLNYLRTPEYGVFSDQIFLADVCGVFSDVDVTDASVTLKPEPRRQLAYYATPEGFYAKGPEGRGVFTDAALDALKQANQWPEQKDLSAALEKTLAELDAPPFRLSGYDDLHQLPDTRVAGNRHFHAVSKLFSKLDVVDSVFRPHYLRTASELGNPELLKARTIREAIQELSSLRGADGGAGVPVGLLMVLARLATEKDLQEPIEQWLEQNAQAQKNRLAEIRSKLRLEALNKILIIVTETNAQEDVAAYKAYLCNNDCIILPDSKFERKSVSGWEHFERSLQELLTPFMSDDRLANLDIHFVVEPSLFDRSFHMIPVAPGQQPIGEDAVVVVRHKQRMLSADQRLQRMWQRYASELQSTKLAGLKWVPLSVEDELPEERGLFFACFTLAGPGRRLGASRAAKDTLRRLLLLGIPYVYLPHGADGANWDKVAERLTKLLSQQPTLGEFPSTFLAERIRGSTIAKDGTIIWDDPTANPFVSRGVRFG